MNFSWLSGATASAAETDVVGQTIAASDKDVRAPVHVGKDKVVLEVKKFTPSDAFSAVKRERCKSFIIPSSIM